jgi:uncharacterized protein YdiU (UPF0061 family)
MLPKYFYEIVRPTPLKSVKLIHTHQTLERLRHPKIDRQNLTAWINGELQFEERFASRYAGHQFGVFAGQLGDGRAITLGKFSFGDQHLEIQTKGSGLTPFSRQGDGKAVIRSSVREYLASIAMEGLGIPTTGVLALLTGTGEVYRESVEREALVARLMPTNLRFGHYEMGYYFNRHDDLRQLIDYTRSEFFSDLSDLEMLETVMLKTARLMSHWQSVGFCHGVMNSDNMSILGLTIDYGPYGFMEDFNLSHICNHSDHQGRYAYNQQPKIGWWNLERLFVTFLPFHAQEKLEQLLNQYPGHFEHYYVEDARAKLGLLKKVENDYQLYVDLLKVLNTHAIDMTFFFRALSRYQMGKDSSMGEFFEYYGKLAGILDWLKKYDHRLQQEDLNDAERSQLMLKTNPKYILRNFIAQEVIESVERGESELLQKWIAILQNPYDELPEFAKYALPTPAVHKHISVSCSS